MRYTMVLPRKSNRRLIAQSGAFIAAGTLKFKRLVGNASIRVRKIVVPQDSKARILQELDQLNINSHSPFHDIEAASRYIRARWQA